MLRAVLLSLLGVAGAPAGHAALDPVRQVGALPFLGPASADPIARLWYEPHIVTVSGTSTYQVAIRDLDTLRLRRTVPLPSMGLILRSSVQPTAVDAARARLFATYYDGKNSARIAVVAGRASTIVADYPALPGVAGDTVRTVYGLGYDAPHDALYVAWQVDTTAVLNKAASTQLMLSELTASTGAVRWTIAIDGCTAFTTEALAVENTLVVRSLRSPALYLSCRTGKASRTTTDAGSSYVVKVNLGQGARPPAGIERFLVPGAPVAAAFAPKTDRLLLSVGVGGQNGVAVFDGAHEVIIGMVPGDMTKLGVDPVSGRLYACPSQFLAADAGVATPVPLGQTYRKVACEDAGAPILVDHSTRRVFVQSTGLDNVVRWLVIRDDTPSYVPEPPERPDSDTVDVAERSGVTSSTFSAAASSYGMRTVLVGGPRGALENLSGPFAYQLVNGLGTAIYKITESLGHPTSQSLPNIAFANREVWLGRVSEARLDAGSATATATGADRNAYVDADLAALSNPQVLTEHPNEDGHQLGWPEEHQRRSCISLGGTTDKPNADGKGVTLRCALGLSVQATALGPRDLVGVAGTLTVGDASSAVTLRRDAKRGAVATVVAKARNVVIGGQAFVDEIAVTTETWARGRRGSAGSSYRREFAGVRVVGADGKPLYACSTPDDCDPTEVVASINAALGNRMRVRLPSLDPVLRGTPGGTRALIARDRWEQLEQQTLNGQQVSDVTMPGLEVELTADNFGQSRLLYQLAGVAAESTYTVSLLPRFGELPREGPAPGGGEVTVTKDTGQSARTQQVIRRSAGTSPTTRTILDRIRAGMRWLFGWNGSSLLVFLTWAMFGVPVYLGVRRRTLTRTALRGGLT